MDRAQIEATIAALDAAVPKDDARVAIHQYGGGPDECTVVANERGYLRLGVEILKAAYGPPVPGNRTESVSVDVDYVLSEDSEVRFNWFERRDPAAPPPPSHWSCSDLGGMALGLGLVTVFVVGCATVGEWIYDLVAASL